VGRNNLTAFFNDRGNNFIGQDTLGVFTTSTLVGTAANPLDPRLAPLGNYGGPTQTHALFPDSPVLNVGNNALASSSIDQRGAARIAGGIVDIGSFESQGFSLLPISGTPQSTTVGTTFSTNLQVQLIENFAKSPIPLEGWPAIFTAPSSGASGSFAGTNVSLTNAAGIAIAPPFAANTIAGRYQVVASASGVNPAAFNLTNEAIAPLFAATTPLTSPTVLTFNPIDLTLLSEVSTPLSPVVAIPDVVVDSVVADIDAKFTQQFEDYLSIETKLVSLEEAQQALQALEAATGIKPAIIYAFFVPRLTSLPSEANRDRAKTEISRNAIAPPSILWQFDGRGVSPSSEGNLAANTSVPQPTDRLELVLVAPTGRPLRYSVRATRAEAIAMARRFRTVVTRNRSLSLSSSSGRQMYEWLISPLEEDLKAQNISNLVFIMDSGLRSIPLAALHDGSGFIVEKYSIGLMPSLSLSNTTYRDIRNMQVLAMGADTFSEQSALPAVPKELEMVTEQLWQGRSFLNEEFTLDNLRGARSQTPYGIIHLATHGEFKAGKPSNSYIQLRDTQLTLDQLRTLGWHDPPVELLVLSACRTALGDVEAELGFAGLAVAAGVKTALGSLWYVSDVGTLGLMVTFYEQLGEVPIKAEALRQAQLAMIRGEVRIEQGQLVTPTQTIPLPPTLGNLDDTKFSQPYYWSAFTLIGNPW